MRVTTNSMMTTLMKQVGKTTSEYQRFNEMIANERRINKLSDDPTGLAMSIRHRSDYSAYEQYTQNIRDAEEYMRMSDSALARMQEIIDRAREIAESTSTETTHPIEREVAAREIQELINESIGVANTKVRDTYIFAGTNSEHPAYSLQGRVLTPLASTSNTYNDIVTSDGEYDGTGEFIVRIVREGYVGDPELSTTAMYQISSDGGETWSDATEFTNLTMHITDSEGNPTGLTMTFAPEFFGEGDEFRLQVVAGKYMGNDENIEFNNNMFSKVLYNVTGQDFFEDTGYFDRLYQLKNALLNGNNLEVQEALESLGTLQTSMQTNVVAIGQAQSRLEITKNNLLLLNENILQSIQGIEKWDYVDLIARFGMAETAMNSAIAALSKVFPASLLNYL